MNIRKSIVSTTAVQLLGSLMNAAFMFTAADALGAEMYGRLSLVIFGVSLAVQAGGIAGGGSIVYLATRMPVQVLITHTYGFGVLACAAVGIIYGSRYFGTNTAAFHIAMLGVLQLLGYVNSMILLGYKRILLYNLMHFAQPLGILATFMVAHRGLHLSADDSFFAAYYTGYGLFMAIGLVGVLLVYLNGEQFTPGAEIYPARKLYALGISVQMANIMQLLNYRLSFFVVVYLYGEKVLGIFALATQCAEWLWKVPKSLAVVEYAQLSSITDPIQQRTLALRFVRVSLMAGLAASVAFLFVPEALILDVVGKEYAGIRNMMLYLLPGIWLFCGSIAIAPYFSGRGLHRTNAWVSFYVLVILTLLMVLCNQNHVQLHLFVMAVALSYAMSFAIGLLIFKRKSKFAWKGLLPVKSDFRLR